MGILVAYEGSQQGKSSRDLEGGYYEKCCFGDQNLRHYQDHWCCCYPSTYCLLDELCDVGAGCCFDVDSGVSDDADDYPDGVFCYHRQQI